MKEWVKYSISNSLLALTIGLVMEQCKEFALTFSAPTATFIVARVFWKIFVPTTVHSKKSKIVLAGCFTGIFSHYVAWILVNVIVFLSDAFSSYSTSSFSAGKIFISPIILSISSLVMFGWLTIPFAIVSGLIIRRSSIQQEFADGIN